MTDAAEIKRLVDGYRKWFKDRTLVKSVHPDWVEVTTPFLDRHNDYIQLYVKSTDGYYELTDDGYTLNDLEASGCRLETDKRKELLRTTLNGFGVEQRGLQLVTRATASNFSFRKHALIQAIMSVSDMFYLAEATMTSEAQEDRCIDCRYWQFIELGRIHTKAGVCKRSPPTAVPFQHDDEADRMRHGRAFWPRTLEHDWCGEFKGHDK